MLRDAVNGLPEMFFVSWDRSHIKSTIKRAVMWYGYRGLPIVRPTIRRVIPHDAEAHTQGLAFHGDVLLESSGRLGKSSIRVLEPDSGRELRRLPIDDHWGEGIAIVNDTLFLLTYTSRRALRFRLPDLSYLGEVAYDGEGWGLTSDGTDLFMTNGTNTLVKRDVQFRVVDEMQVSHRGRRLDRLNDIEVCGSSIFCNVLFESHLLWLSRKTGTVSAIVDCSGIVRLSHRRNAASVLNGIAYRSTSSTFFVTGKHWPRMFEISLPDLGDSNAQSDARSPR